MKAFTMNQHEPLYESGVAGFNVLHSASIPHSVSLLVALHSVLAKAHAPGPHVELVVGGDISGIELGESTLKLRFPLKDSKGRCSTRSFWGMTGWNHSWVILGPHFHVCQQKSWVNQTPKLSSHKTTSCLLKNAFVCWYHFCIFLYHPLHHAYLFVCLMAGLHRFAGDLQGVSYEDFAERTQKHGQRRVFEVQLPGWESGKGLLREVWLAVNRWKLETFSQVF